MSGASVPGSPVVTSSIAYPMPVANSSAAAGVGAVGGRTLFNGTVVSPQNTGGAVQGGQQKRQPSLGFAPGEYDPNFQWDVKDAYVVGEDEDDVAGRQQQDGQNFAGRGAWRG
jgi:hypothetical protein